MGGGDGGVIVRDGIVEILTNPVVSGSLPPATKALIVPILAKDHDKWSARDKRDLSGAITWAMCNLP